MLRSAQISACGTYRYSLTRKWSDEGTLVIVGLNPSTADATVEDRTVARCINFAMSWGYGELVLANLFALRSPYPKKLRQARDPIGPQNNRTLKRLSARADLLLVAWGNHGLLLGRYQEVLPWLTDPHCLGTTKKGMPRHPLYVRSNTKPTLYSCECSS